MAGRSVGRLAVSRGRAIAAAVVRRRKVRAAFQDFPRNPDVGLTWIKACNFRSAARIVRNTARFWLIGLLLDGPPAGEADGECCIFSTTGKSLRFCGTVSSPLV